MDAIQLANPHFSHQFGHEGTKTPRIENGEWKIENGEWKKQKTASAIGKRSRAVRLLLRSTFCTSSLCVLVPSWPN